MIILQPNKTPTTTATKTLGSQPSLKFRGSNKNPMYLAKPQNLIAIKKISLKHYLYTVRAYNKICISNG